MRAWLVILMVALLPLRGWVGEAMAGQMLAQQLQAALPAAPAAAHVECPGHAVPASLPDDKASAGHGVCSTCQLCSTVALDRAFATVLPAAVPQAPPAMGPVRFASAERALGLKPPIS